MQSQILPFAAIDAIFYPRKGCGQEVNCIDEGMSWVDADPPGTVKLPPPPNPGLRATGGAGACFSGPVDDSIETSLPE